MHSWEYLRWVIQMVSRRCMIYRRVEMCPWRSWKGRLRYKVIDCLSRNLAHNWEENRDYGGVGVFIALFTQIPGRTHLVWCSCWERLKGALTWHNPIHQKVSSPILLTSRNPRRKENVNEMEWDWPGPISMDVTPLLNTCANLIAWNTSR